MKPRSASRLPVPLLHVLVGLFLLSAVPWRADAAAAAISVASASLGSASSGGRVSVFVTLRNGGATKVRGTIKASVPTAGGTERLSKRFKLKPHETKEFKVGRAHHPTGAPHASVSVTSSTAAADGSEVAGGGNSNKGLSGHWSGTYSAPGGSHGISASVRQSGGTLTIVTSKSGPGHRMSGSIRGGRLHLTDPVGGQTWTGSANGNRIVVRDILANLTPPGMQTITLHR